MKIKQNIPHIDANKSLWADVTTSNITIGGASSKVITGGDLQVTRIYWQVWMKIKKYLLMWPVVPYK